MEVKKLTVIIPTFNKIELLKECLQSLTKQTFKDFETIVIDNGSNDKTAEFLNSNYPKIKIIPTLKYRGILQIKGKYNINNTHPGYKKYKNYSIAISILFQHYILYFQRQ